MGLKDLTLRASKNRIALAFAYVYLTALLLFAAKTTLIPGAQIYVPKAKAAIGRAIDRTGEYARAVTTALGEGADEIGRWVDRTSEGAE